MSNIEFLQEAARRGILPPDKKPIYDEAVKRGLIKPPTQMQASHTPVGQAPDPDAFFKEEMKKNIEGMSGLDRVLVGIGKGFMDVGQGAKQIGLKAGEAVGMVPKGRHDEYTRGIQADEEKYDKPLFDQSTGANVGRFIGNVAATAPMPGGVGKTLVAKVLSGAGAGAASAALMPTKEGESRLENAAIGGLMGGGMTGLLGAGGKAIKAIRGDDSVAVARDLARQGGKFDVPLTVGELRQNPAIQRIEQLLERVPLVGTRGFREKQANKLAIAARTLADNYGAGIDDVGEELQSSLSRSLAANKRVATELYDRVGEEAAKRGGMVDLSNVRATARGIASRERGLPEQFRNQKIMDQVEKWIAASSPKKGHGHGAKPLIVDQYGRPMSKEVDLSGGLDFKTARKLRSRLGQEVRSAEKQAISGAVPDEEVAALKMLRRAVEDDIQTFATKGGGDLSQAFNAANAHYVENVVPFKDRMIRKAGREDFDTDQIINTFVKSDRPQLAAKLMGRLDARGQTAVKFAVLKDAFDAASEGKTPFSPAKFAQRLEKLGKSKKTIFDLAESKQIEGFVRLSRAAERAGQYAENPPTGMRVIDTAILGGGIAGAMFEPTALLLGGSASMTLSKLLTSDAGRKLLTRASGLPPESQIMRRLLMTDLPRAMAIKGEEIKNDSDPQGN